MLPSNGMNGVGYFQLVLLLLVDLDSISGIVTSKQKTFH